MAIGQMGLGLDDFLNLTPFEFLAIQKAFFEKLKADREWEFNTKMQVARWQVWRTLCPPDKKQISLMDLVELPGDEAVKNELKQKQTTPEKYEQAKRKMGTF